MWLFRLLADSKLQVAYDKLKGDHAALESRLTAASQRNVQALGALADCQLSATQAEDTSRRAYTAMKARYEALIASIKDAHADRVDALEGDIGDLKVRLERADDEALRLNAELLEVSGRLADAEERLAECKECL